jgi:hypothetical protein
VVTSLLALYFAFQLFFPLRHLKFEGDPNWSQRGHNFSWRMMLRSKEFHDVNFRVVDRKTGEEARNLASPYLNRYTKTKMATDPEFIRQFAHFLAERARAARNGDVSVHAEIYVSLNGRPKQLIVDPKVDLAALEDTSRAGDWIVPLEHVDFRGGRLVAEAEKSD